MKWIIPCLLVLLSVWAAPAHATIRGSSCQSSSTNNAVVAWSGFSGVSSGDEAYIFGDTAFNQTLPSGWSDTPSTGSAYFVTGSVWDGTAFWKTLNSTDISTGNVTVHSAGTFDVTYCLVVFVGNPGVVREIDCGSGATILNCRSGPQSGAPTGGPEVVTTSSGVVPTDMLLLLASQRNSGVVNRTVTLSSGTTLNTADSGANAYVKLGYACLASGVTNETFTWGNTASAGDWNQIILVVEGAGASAPCPTNTRHKATVY